MSNIQLILIGAAFFILDGYALVMMEREMKVCQLTHSYDVCVTTLR